MVENSSYDLGFVKTESLRRVLRFAQWKIAELKFMTTENGIQFIGMSPEGTYLVEGMIKTRIDSDMKTVDGFEFHASVPDLIEFSYRFQVDEDSEIRLSVTDEKVSFITGLGVFIDGYRGENLLRFKPGKGFRKKFGLLNFWGQNLDPQMKEEKEKSGFVSMRLKSNQILDFIKDYCYPERGISLKCCPTLRGALHGLKLSLPEDEFEDLLDCFNEDREIDENDELSAKYTKFIPGTDMISFNMSLFDSNKWLQGIYGLHLFKKGFIKDSEVKIALIGENKPLFIGYDFDDGEYISIALSPRVLESEDENEKEKTYDIDDPTDFFVDLFSFRKENKSFFPEEHWELVLGAIIGGMGSGKSTLLQFLATLGKKIYGSEFACFHTDDLIYLLKYLNKNQEKRKKVMFFFLDDALTKPGADSRRAMSADNVKASQNLSIIRHLLANEDDQGNPDPQFKNGFCAIFYAVQDPNRLDPFIRRNLHITLYKTYYDSLDKTLDADNLQFIKDVTEDSMYRLHVKSEIDCELVEVFTIFERSRRYTCV